MTRNIMTNIQISSLRLLYEMIFYPNKIIAKLIEYKI